MDLETHGPLGTLWVGLGLGAFYIALIWINSLLGLFTTPLFIVPLTWIMDRMQKKPVGAGGLIRAETLEREQAVAGGQVVRERVVVR